MKRPPKPYHHGDLRQALLDSAREILNTQGFEPLSLREVAKRAEVSPAAPYRHFKSREALLAALAEEGFAGLEKGMKVAARKHQGDTTAQLHGLGRAYLQLALGQPHFFRMMFSVDLGPSRAAEGIMRACDRVYLSLVEIFTTGQAHGQIKVGDAERQALLLWSTLHGYSMLLIDRKLDDLKLSNRQQLDLLEEMLSTMFAGLALLT